MLVRIEIFHCLLNKMGVVDSTLTSLWMKIIVVDEYCLFIGFKAIIARMSSISTDLACHASI